MTNALIHIFIRDAENTGDSRVREKFGVLSGAVGLACNLFLFALKLIIGLLTGSISIAADAFNNLSDGLSCLISIVGFKVSGKEPDAKHPFGYGRTEYIAGLIVSFIIILVGFEFFKTSLDRILHPAAVAFSAVLMGNPHRYRRGPSCPLFIHFVTPPLLFSQYIPMWTCRLAGNNSGNCVLKKVKRIFQLSSA